MSFPDVFGNLDWNIFFVTQPWCLTFNTNFAFIFDYENSQIISWKVKSNPVTMTTVGQNVWGTQNISIVRNLKKYLQIIKKVFFIFSFC